MLCCVSDLGKAAELLTGAIEDYSLQSQQEFDAGVQGI
jgi:hypothetical protein